MSNKNKQKVDMASIKEFEKAQRSKVQKEEAPTQSVSFDQWWADSAASLKIAPSLKEVLRADFKGRSVEGLNTKERWDWAAKQFGLII